MKKAAIWIILFFAFCGLANSAYLTQHEVNGTPLLCNVNGLSGCNIVAASPYSHIFGITLAEYGLMFYGLLFFVCALEIAINDRVLRRVIQGLALLGILASLYFTFLQIFVINALCVYCLASATLALLIFIFAFFVEPVRRNVFDRRDTPPSNASGQTVVTTSTVSHSSTYLEMPPSQS